MAMIELVDFNELYNGGKKEEKKGRSRRGGKAKKADPSVSEQATQTTTEAPVAESPTLETSSEEPTETAE